MSARIILYCLLALFSAHGSRVVYDTPSPVVSTSWVEIVMAQAAKEGTYRFSASIETRPGEGCDAETVLYFVRSYIGATGAIGVQRHEIRIHKKGSTVTSVAEIPASTFRVKAGSRISYHVEYMIGGRCKVRPTYKVFPLLEQVGK